MFSQYNYFFLKASGAPETSGARGLCPRWLHGCDAPVNEEHLVASLGTPVFPGTQVEKLC